MTGSAQLTLFGNIVMVKLMDRLFNHSSLNNNFNRDRVPVVQQVSVLVGALCLYLFIWFLSSFDLEAYMQVDSVDYRLLGKEMFTKWHFPSSFRTPVFPAFVGFLETLLGLNISQFVLIQIALALANIYMLGRLVSYFAAAKWQLFAMIVFSLDLVTIQVANYVLSETLFSFLLLLSLNLMLAMCYSNSDHFKNSQSNKRLYALSVMTGLSLGLFALCRPVGQFLPFLLLLWLLFFKQQVFKQEQQTKKQVYWMSVIILLGSLAVMHAWKLNNLINKGHYFVSATTSYNMYNYRAAWNVAYRDGRTFVDVKQEFQDKREQFKRENPQLSNYEIGQHFTKEGLGIILSTPKETFFQAMRGLVFLYGGIYSGSLERIFQKKWALKASQLYSLVYSGLLYFGILLALFYWRVLSSAQKALFSLCAIIVFYFTFFSIGVESYARLRAPFMPYLVIMSILGWLNCIYAQRSKRLKAKYLKTGF